jgi:hypothetical protein
VVRVVRSSHRPVFLLGSAPFIQDPDDPPLPPLYHGELDVQD